MPSSPTEHIDVGTVVGGTYRVTRLIGRGGMGTVWAAQHLRLPGRQVAIKVLTIGADIDPHAYARFRREAEIAARGGHPNIVEVYDLNELPDGTPYIVLEYLGGESLRARMQRGPMSFEESMAVVVQVAWALGALHRAGVIHRDLTPANVFLCTSDSQSGPVGRVKVLDFGISKIRGAQTLNTEINQLIGTPRYMAPEQISGNTDAVDLRIDIFALGSIAYEMLTGRPVFKGETMQEILYKVLYEQPRPLLSLAPDVPDRIAAAVHRALEKDPDRRFADVDSFLAALQLGAAGSEAPAGGRPTVRPGIRTEVSTVPVRPARLERRLPWRFAGRALLALVVIAAISLGANLLERRLGTWFGAPPPPAVEQALDETGYTVAVLEFRNQRPDDAKSDWYCKALQSAFNTELSKLPQISVIAPELIESEARKRGADPLTTAKSMGANRFVTGSFAVVGEQIRIDARFVDANRGLQEVAENVEGRQDEFFDLQKRLALKTLGSLQIKLTAAQEASLKKRTNANVDKYRMLLEAEGVGGGEAVAAPPAPDAQSRRPAATRFAGGLSLVSVAHAQTEAELEARDVLEQYRLAFERGDLELLASLYVAFPESQRKSVTAYLDNVEDLRVTLADVTIQARESDVAVSYTRHDEFVDRDTGEEMTLEVRVTKFLVQDGGRWKFARES